MRCARGRQAVKTDADIDMSPPKERPVREPGTAGGKPSGSPSKPDAKRFMRHMAAGRDEQKALPPVPAWQPSPPDIASDAAFPRLSERLFCAPGPPIVGLTQAP